MARFSISVWEPGYVERHWTATIYEWRCDRRVLWFKTTEGLKVSIKTRNGQILIEEMADVIE